MSYDDWNRFREEYIKRSNRFVCGDGATMAELFADVDPVGICGAFGGFESGVENVHKRVAWAGDQFSEGIFSEELIHEHVDGNMAFTFAIETIDARVAGQPEIVRQQLRVTQVYRRGDNGWQIVQRHADFVRPTSTTGPTALS